MTYAEQSDDAWTEHGAAGDPDRTRLAGRHAGPMAVRLAAYARERAESAPSGSLQAMWEALAVHWGSVAYGEADAARDSAV